MFDCFPVAEDEGSLRFAFTNHYAMAVTLGWNLDRAPLPIHLFQGSMNIEKIAVQTIAVNCFTGARIAGATKTLEVFESFSSLNANAITLRYHASSGIVGMRFALSPKTYGGFIGQCLSALAITPSRFLLVPKVSDTSSDQNQNFDEVFELE